MAVFPGSVPKIPGANQKKGFIMINHKLYLTPYELKVLDELPNQTALRAILYNLTSRTYEEAFSEGESHMARSYEAALETERTLAYDEGFRHGEAAETDYQVEALINHRTF